MQSRCADNRQGSLHRNVFHVRLAIHEDVVSCGSPRLDAIRFHAESGAALGGRC